MRKKLGIALGIVVVVVVGIAFALPYLVDVNRYHDRITAEVQKRLGRNVSLGPMRLSIIPLAFQVQGATIAEDPSFGEGKVFAKADQLYVSAKLWPLLHSDVQVSALEMERPQIELVRNAGGVWNFASLGHNPETAVPPQGQTPEEQARAAQGKNAQKPQEFALDHLRIRDGQIAVTDFQKRQPRAVYDHVDLSVDNYKPGQPFQLDAAAHFPGQGKETARLVATAGPVQQNVLTTPVDGTLKLDEVSLAGVDRFLNTQALANTDGMASGEASVKSSGGKLESQGTLQLANAKIRGTDIGYPISADYQLNADLNSDLYTIKKGTLKLGSTPVSLTGVINNGPTPAQLDVRVWTPEAPIAEVARLAAAFGVAFNPGMKIDGRVQADVQAKGAASHPLLNGTLSAKNLTMSGKGLKQPVQVQGVQLALSPEAVRSNEFAATTNGTNVAVQFNLTQYTTENPQVQASVRTSGAQLDDVLAIARAYGVQAVEGMSGSGRLTIDLHANGSLKNANAMALSGSGALESATLRMPALAVPVQVRNAGIRFSQNSAVLENLSAGVGETHATGTMTLQNFAAPQAVFALAVDKLNLAEMQTWFTPSTSGGVTPQAHASESTFAKAVGHGKVTVGQIVYDQLLLNNVKSDATLDHGVIRMAPLTADVYGGQETGSITLDTRESPMAMAVNTRLEKVDANKLLSSTTSLKQVLYGILMGNGNMTFRTGGGSDQIARSLNGNLSLDLRNGKITNMDFWYELARAGGFLGGGQQAQPFTNLLALTGDFQVQNGVAQTNNLKAVIDGATITGEGFASLADQSLNMRVLAVISKARSQQIGGTSVGGFMRTALANQNGELVIPVIVQGTFSRPQFSPDLGRIAQMKLNETFSNPIGAAGSVLRGILGGGQQQQQQYPPPEQPQQQQGQPQPPPPQQQQQPGQTSQPQGSQQQQQIWQQILDAAQKRKQKQQQQQQPPPDQQDQPPK
jgi:uncharacterized protein involved in outer membrane biogenesis